MSAISKPSFERETPAEHECDASNLPDGWTNVGFMEVFDVQGGTQPPKSEFVYEPTDGYVRLLQIRDFGEKPVPTYIRQKPSLKTCTSNDVLIGRYGASVGRICTGMEGAYNVALTKVIIPDDIDPRFAYYLLNSDAFQRPLLEIERSAQDGFNKEDLAEIRLPLAPLAEQRRIVAKLELLLGKVSSSQQRLSRVPALLKRFRQSVLAAACSGKLTADWREKSTQSILVFSDAEDIGSGIPESWRIVAVRDVIGGLKYGTSKKCDYPRRGVPVLRIPNIADGVINQSDMKYAHLDPDELEQLRLRVGDVLLIRSNGSVSLVGKTALVRETERDFAYAGYLIRLRPDQAKIIPEFLNAVLGSYDVRLQIEIPARSTSGVNNINSEEVRALRIPLPPLSEQQEIVRRVEKLFEFADQIEARLVRAQKQVDRLTQSILGKAFRGELVPTEHSLATAEGREYEPASELLARIRASKTNAEPARRKRGKASKT